MWPLHSNKKVLEDHTSGSKRARISLNLLSNCLIMIFMLYSELEERHLTFFLEILQQNTIFVSQGRKPQRHVRWQLACFLIRYGQLGSPVHDTMLKIGIGYGTVILYCRRVIRAFWEL
ncbi:hypothetical protein F5890DRAFT_1534736 [Lentinula detonsa]|uniref:Uncharacterized protein n=1 Tax=Lentinula detonsa TaxID=2804962 RepID=A0AA38UQE9_9AGAR|nr:hypothetical protein F5890DRAFT_1534736 [Lentinula detonsa]